jgi:hypothetical protein
VQVEPFADKVRREEQRDALVLARRARAERRGRKARQRVGPRDTAARDLGAVRRQRRDAGGGIASPAWPVFRAGRNESGTGDPAN